MASLLPFQERSLVLDLARSIFGVRRRVPLRPTSVGPNVIRVGDMLPVVVVSYLQQPATARAVFRRTVRNAGRRAIDRIRKKVRQLDLISPPGTPTRRLFLSSWRAELLDITGTGLAIDLVVVNSAPYALYVHPKRTPRSRTFINTDLPEIMAEIASEISSDLMSLVSRILQGRT